MRPEADERVGARPSKHMRMPGPKSCVETVDVANDHVLRTQRVGMGKAVPGVVEAEAVGMGSTETDPRRSELGVLHQCAREGRSGLDLVAAHVAAPPRGT
jgi:hypothetical protein